MRARRLLIVVAILAMALLVGLLGAAPAGAVAPTSASCIGQFFSAHAGIVPATGGEESTVKIWDATLWEDKAGGGR